MITSQGAVAVVPSLRRCLWRSVAERICRVNVLAKALGVRRVQSTLGVLDQSGKGPVAALGDRHNHLNRVIATVAGDQVALSKVAAVVGVAVVALSEGSLGSSRAAACITDQEYLNVVAVDLE